MPPPLHYLRKLRPCHNTWGVHYVRPSLSCSPAQIRDTYRQPDATKHKLYGQPNNTWNVHRPRERYLGLHNTLLPRFGASEWRSTNRFQVPSRSMSSAKQSQAEGPETQRGEPVEATTAPSIPNSPAYISPRKFSADLDEFSEQSLLEELFPEASTSMAPDTHDSQAHYPKIDLPNSPELIRTQSSSRAKSLKEQLVESFQRRGEDIAVLQLEHCSTELAEADFRRLIPKGKHIETWNRDGEFYKVIPGRDPLSLERLPFYFLLFKSADAAVAYQKHVSRLHKLTAMHRPGSVLSAIASPAGFLENGDDINAATNTYTLKPGRHSLALHALMQPYHPALRTLFERGGYRPIVPEILDTDERVFKVLLQIEGYEPSPSDLFKIIFQSSYNRGIRLALRNESSSSIKRLRDVINIKTRLKPASVAKPRAYGHWEQLESEDQDIPGQKLEFEDRNIAFSLRALETEDVDCPRYLNQVIMNKVYNRWIIEFDDEFPARRFAADWHRRTLPDIIGGNRTWKDYEEPQICSCEFLW